MWFFDWFFISMTVYILMGLLKDIQKTDILTKGAKNVRYGIDYLRFNFQQKIPYFDRILNSLDYDNSNIFFDENDFSYTKIPLTTWPALIISVSYENKPVPFMMYNVFTSWIKSSYSRIDFYGAYFRFEEIGFFPLGWRSTFIKELTSENPTITRIDYCFDLFYDDLKLLPKPKEVLPTLKTKLKRWLYTFSNGWKEESRASWRSSSKNIIVRMYDKLVDLDKKGKFFLYDDYQKWDTVHRFEVQFWPSFCRWYRLDTFDYLMWRIGSIFRISSLSDNSAFFYSYARNTKITDYSRLFYTKQFVWRSQKFFDSWINPYLILFEYNKINCTNIQQINQHKIYLLELYIELKKYDLLVEHISK